MSISSVSLPIIARGAHHANSTQRLSRLVVKPGSVGRVSVENLHIEMSKKTSQSGGKLSLYAEVAHFAEREQIQGMFAISLYV